MKLSGKWILLLALAALGLFAVLRVFRSPTKSNAGANPASLKIGQTEK